MKQFLYYCCNDEIIDTILEYILRNIASITIIIPVSVLK